MNPQILVQMDSHGRVVLPQPLCGKGKKYFACETDKDGTVHLIPVVGIITSKQAYFWTKRWQKGEQEALKAIRKGKYKVVSPDKLKSYLDSL
jgi:hypothetical protein